MRIEQARRIARQWVLEEGAALPGFGGAFLTGSALWDDPRAELAPASDVDVMLVAEPAVRLGKFAYRGVILEVSSIPGLGSPHEVLSDYHLAGSLHLPGVLADPSGRLAELQRVVARDFAERPWVLARCTNAMDRVRGWINGMDESAPLPDQVAAWLFGTGVTTHVLLVAALRNPTVRRRYAAVRDLLAEHGRASYHESLLDLLGCAGLAAARVERHLAALERVFDAAAPVHAPSYPFASDITELARPIAIDGTRELIRRGLHREAVFWLVATYARCLAKRAAAGESGHEDGLRELLADLDAESFADRRHRGNLVLAALPELWQTAMALC
ncbi:hypothetical protein SAMN05444920_110257 [Nonomuraea solani]|uniref:Nucleotidyltransferase domain-containing protein n=1 Tax=Nonomuraea solani TaxID=1144553 RepID=A0A1H6EH48_9ACTN|nr:hypothetical protein [Nonomuraea solani]SEG97178.1 hypothetical protein SAMN05444920_110257 [Nonomuraea solani]